MLFNSYIFLYVFFPVVYIGYFTAARVSRELGIGWLLICSLFFYGWWDSRYVPLLVGSIVFNYTAAAIIVNATRYRGYLLAIAITTNLALLAWFKYANFFFASVSAVSGLEWSALNIVLPLGISFFTFTQIAFLVDVWRGEVREYNFVHYALFVTYFPHLIAGPILHHKEMMPQFKLASSYRFNLGDAGLGLFIFSIGLFKKVVLADSVQIYVAPVFDAPAGIPLTFDEAWAGALAYTFQLYFDFSGYSDMAIGLSQMFGIVLPLNFNSPYKAVNIIDFWRRWHMTLSRFLRDYLYISLGGNRKGPVRRYVNLLATMFLGGLWHGASWTFVAWGGLHGFYLVVNHVWHRLCGTNESSRGAPFGRALGVVTTFLAVVTAWVLFRATNYDNAVRILASMWGFHGISFPMEWLAWLGGTGQALSSAGITANTHHLYTDGLSVWVWILFGFVTIWGFPNSQELFKESRLGWIFSKKRANQKYHRERLAALMGALCVAILMLSAISGSRGTSEFIYFNF